MSRVFIGVGSNLGHRFGFLLEGRSLVSECPGFTLRKASPNYETAPVGGPVGQRLYLNAVWEFETALPPEEVLKVLLEVEKKMGRERGEPNAPRTLDLDLLVYDDVVLDSGALTLPHPRMQERPFVLKPLSDIAPSWKHPVLKLSASKLLEAGVEGCPKS